MSGHAKRTLAMLQTADREDDVETVADDALASATADAIRELADEWAAARAEAIAAADCPMADIEDSMRQLAAAIERADGDRDELQAMLAGQQQAVADRGGRDG